MSCTNYITAHSVEGLRGKQTTNEQRAKISLWALAISVTKADFSEIFCCFFLFSFMFLNEMCVLTSIHWQLKLNFMWVPALCHTGFLELQMQTEHDDQNHHSWAAQGEGGKRRYTHTHVIRQTVPQSKCDGRVCSRPSGRAPSREDIYRHLWAKHPVDLERVVLFQDWLQTTPVSAWRVRKVVGGMAFAAWNVEPMIQLRHWGDCPVWCGTVVPFSAGAAWSLSKDCALWILGK